MLDPEQAIGTTWGTFVQRTREAKKLTIDELADLLDVDRKTVMRIESGENKRVDLLLLLRACRALGVRPADAVAALDPEESGVELPPPLPPQIARLIDNLLATGEADRPLLLERIDWVNQWIELYNREPDRRRRDVRRRA